MIWIEKDVKHSVSKNFDISEFFSKSPDVTAHYFDEKLIPVMQFLRSYMKEPIIITSTYRSQLVNFEIGSNENSMHRKGMAVDFTCNNITKLINDIREAYIAKNEFWYLLRNLGVRGIGVYPDRKIIHLDTRHEGFLTSLTKHDDLGTFEYWDSQKKKLN